MNVPWIVVDRSKVKLNMYDQSPCCRSKDCAKVQASLRMLLRVVSTVWPKGTLL